MKSIWSQMLLVGVGSFLGGSLRFLCSKLLLHLISSPFPYGTFSVNILGCFLIGFISALPSTTLSPQTRLLLTTGFCGGFTTFSTFMNEGVSLTKSGHTLLMVAYLSISLILGFLAVILGHHLAKQLQ